MQRHFHITIELRYIYYPCLQILRHLKDHGKCNHGKIFSAVCSKIVSTSTSFWRPLYDHTWKKNKNFATGENLPFKSSSCESHRDRQTHTNIYTHTQRHTHRESQSKSERDREGESGRQGNVPFADSLLKWGSLLHFISWSSCLRKKRHAGTGSQELRPSIAPNPEYK